MPPFTSEIPPELNAFFMAISFILGAMVGSFANVCICRWPADQSVVSPRSRCPKCGNALAWYDNIPMVSWLVLGARCRNCKAPISWQYPVVEALTGVLFLLVYWRFGLTLATPVYWFLAAGLVIVTFVDIAEWIIPNEITFSGIPVGIAAALIGMGLGEASGLRVTSVFDALIGVALGGGILYALDQLTQLILKKPGMGMGDVKLLAMLGAFLGWQGVLGTLMIACVIGSAVGLGLIAVQRMRSAHSGEGENAPYRPDSSEYEEDPLPVEGNYLPFGPYLALAGIIYVFVGPEALDAYLGALTMAPGVQPML
jgi:leader peptidase (prepilin peptidase)/N-methyltransferase